MFILKLTQSLSILLSLRSSLNPRERGMSPPYNRVDALDGPIAG